MLYVARVNTREDLLSPSDVFVGRHLGPSESDVASMLATLEVATLEALIDQTVPRAIRIQRPLALAGPRPEHGLLADLRATAERNEVYRSFIGTGYHDCITPPVIQRNILENPGWYTQYTPYQAEISQGRLEALINFQTMVGDLCALPLANSSLLDEATAAAEAMTMCRAISRGKRSRFFVADDCHPQTIAVMQTRADAAGVALQVAPLGELSLSDDLAGVLVQYPTTDGTVHDYADLADKVHGAGALLVVAADLLALTLLRAPGEFGADIAVGSTQRFGVPMGFGGPHAAYLATSEKHKRQVPGRIIGVSKDARGAVAYRLALQTREQHIRRDRATSNICTAQVLLAIMAGMYAVHHGPDGLRTIARRVLGWTRVLAAGLGELGLPVRDGVYFDTLRISTTPEEAERIIAAALSRRMNLRRYPGGDLGVSLDETTGADDITDLLAVFAPAGRSVPEVSELSARVDANLPAPHARTSAFLTHPCYELYRGEHELLRYLHRLQAKDLSLTTSMIPLGSCTMKLNGTSEMVPITWPEFAALHPFAPADQAKGYYEMFGQLESWLAEITGMSAVSLQPNSGAQGEYTGLLVIRAYHHRRGDAHRTVCLIPVSAHGTNPASAVMAGFKVVTVACDDRGNIDVADLRAKAEANKDSLGALMITYPSTHGVFEETVSEVCEIIHAHGGQVYLDGANMNAQVGLARPGDFGADVIHLNLHKTFAIPHGGGGPGVGPIAVAEHLAPCLPAHPVLDVDEARTGPVSAAPFGSSSVLPISWMYIALMGGTGLTRASQIAILSANYMAKRISSHYDILYTGSSGRVAHEFIVDCREFKKTAGITVDDIAKRLMDYGFHAPTMSWPVAGTLMIEPTESESRAELDRLCDAMIAIREEIRAIEEGRADREDNPLKHAPHTARAVTSDEWPHAYSREQAAYPAAWLRSYKYWPPVARVDNAWGDRNLMCTCPPLDAYED